MREIQVESIKDANLTGVRIQLPEEERTYSESYFEWHESKLTANFNTNEVSGGVVNMWHHKYKYDKVEWHRDEEMFYFVDGDAVMLFADLDGDKVNPDTIQIVTIPEGTQIIIEARKAHFVPTLRGDGKGKMIVCCPKMDAIMVNLEESVLGVI